MRKYIPLMCKDCPTEIFVNVNMVMIKDELWASICDKKEDALCDNCMEKKLGRKITQEDFKKSSMGLDVIPCNAAWLWNKKTKEEKEIEFKEFMQNRKKF